MKSGKGWEATEGMWDVTGASWLDVDDDGTLDIMVQRSGEQDEGGVGFVRNGFYHDAFFLRAQGESITKQAKNGDAVGNDSWEADVWQFSTGRVMDRVCRKRAVKRTA